MENEKIPYPKSVSELYSLDHAARKAGVKNLYEFNNWGYKGLYDEDITDILKRKGLQNIDYILDYMDNEELSLNTFRISQTISKLKTENIKTESDAFKAHYEAGQEVRNLIKRLDGIMPEELPTLKKKRDFNLDMLR